MNDQDFTDAFHYANAKVVLLGDSGVGKSGLSLVLAGQTFQLTESTHGRHVLVLDGGEAALEEGGKEIRETLLWDLAGQPGYRLIHQLHLNEVAVALIVFDSRSETDPFAGVHYWNRALTEAQRMQGTSAFPVKKFLVAARSDRGGIGVSSQRIKSLVEELGFDAYFETSAKTGKNIKALRDAISAAVDWETLPIVTSSGLFQRIKTFLTAGKAQYLITTVQKLYSSFLQANGTLIDASELFVQFETCIGRIESAGLIRRFSFGDLVLLQPELLDAYASALINAVKDEPDGLGSIAEARARTGDFYIPVDERLNNREQEKFLLIALIEDLLQRELVLRENPFLVFPSQSTRENPTLPQPEGAKVVFTFEGAVLNIYTSLAVRLSHSGLFKKKELWKNAITYTLDTGGIYGLLLRNIDEGKGELSLFFDQMTNEETRFLFEAYIHRHLQSRAIPETIKRRRIFVCDICDFVVSDQLLHLRKERGYNSLHCPVCNNFISLLDHGEKLVVPSTQVSVMDRVADAKREQAVANTRLQGKRAAQDFDVFLCYSAEDRVAVKQIGMLLQQQGLLPWLDEWELRPGLSWQDAIEKQVKSIKAAAVFVGKNGIGPWQREELRDLLREFAVRRAPVIPVLLLDAPQHIPNLPLFLQTMVWVDFRRKDIDPFEQLMWGITGKRSVL